jgi:hypothetical protein
MVFWLGAWTVGGATTLLFMRRLLQRSVPETITLEPAGRVHDPGVPAMQFERRSRRIPWSELFPSRVVARIDHRALEALRLREAEAGNRLTVDCGIDRIELARAATHVEREWLQSRIAGAVLDLNPQPRTARAEPQIALIRP